MRELLKSFGSLSIVKKSMVSPVVILVMMLGSCVITFMGLTSIQTKVEGITRDLAPDAGTAALITQQVYRKRLQVKDYVKTSSETSIQKYDAAEEELQRILAKARDEISNPDRVALLNNINSLNNEYNNAFRNVVVANMNRRHEIVNGVMNVKGPFIEDSLSSIMETAYRDGDPEASYFAGQSQTHLLLGRLYAFRFLVDNDERSKQRVISEFGETKSKMQTLLESLQNPERRALANGAIDAIDAYLVAFSQVVEAIDARNSGVRDTLDRIGPVMAEDSVKLRASVFESLTEQGQVVEAGVSRTEISIISVAVIAFVIGLFVAYAVAKGVTRPLLHANSMLRDIAEGDGDLTKRLVIDTEDEIGELGRNFNAFVDKLQELIKRLAANVQQLAVSAEEMSEVTEKNNASIVKQRSETEAVAHAMSEMSLAVKEVARNAEEASQAAQEADSDADAGNQLVQGMIASIDGLAGEVEKSATVIEELKSESQSIGSVLDVIKEIAEQTNLLALNATIEAARAGDEGRGFAVVASEVRELAQRTQDSTKQIEGLISSLQGGASSAFDMMTMSRDRARSTVDQAQTTGGSLSAITRAVATISEMNTQIASAATEQEAVTKDINRNVTNISELSDHTASASEQTANSCQDVARLGGELRTMVSQFKV